MFRRQPKAVSVLDQAKTLLQRGETVRAEEIALKAISETQKRYGTSSPQYAEAQNDLGMILLYVGQRERAAAAFAASCAATPTESQALRDHLTYLGNWGQVLEMTGRFEEAESVLRRGLAGRLAYYGREHAGYAFGLEPLADLLLRMQKPNDALPLIDDTIANFRHNQHPRLWGALALRAEALKRARNPTLPFVGYEAASPEEMTELASAVINRTESMGPQISRLVLADTYALVAPRLGAGHSAVLQLLSAVVEAERLLDSDGDPVRRQWAIQQVITACDQQGRRQEALQAAMGLALAQSEAGDPEAAVASYHNAVARAQQTGDLALVSQVRRNLGLLLVDMDRRPEAEAEMRQAISDAEQGGNREMLGRAMVALGIFYQHNERKAEAQPLLDKSLDLLDPAHPDAICARSHRNALASGASCGCGDTGEAIAQAFREFVISRLPNDLLERFDVSLENNDFKLEVRLKRKPTERELDSMNRVIQHALEEFRKRLAQS